MKAVKWILGGLVALVVVIAVAGYIAIQSIDLEQVRTLAETRAKEATGRDLKVAGDIDFKISLTPAISLSDVSFGNAEWGSRPEMMTLKRFDLEVAVLPLLSGAVEVNRLVLVEPDILLETNAEGQGNWQLGEAGAAPAAPETGGDGGDGAMDIALARFDELVIQDGRVTYRDGVTGQETRLALERLAAAVPSPSTPITFEMAGSYNDEAFSAEGTVGSVDQLQSGPFPVDVAAEAGGADITVAGSIAQPMAGEGVDLSITAKGDSLAGFSGFAGNPLPELGPYDLAVKVGKSGDQVTFEELALKLGESDLAGSGSLALGAAKPTFSGNFTSELLDLADFQAETAGADGAGEPAADQGQASTSADSQYIFTEEPLPLDGLQAANADVKLRAGLLRLQPEMELTDLDMALTLNDGDLRVAPFNSGFGGGVIAAEIGLDASRKPAGLATTMLVEDLDYGQLLKDMEINDQIAGRLDMDVDLRGQGNSMREIASGLDGYFEVTGGQGTIDNRLLKLIAGGLGDIMGPLFGDERTASLNCIVTRFEVADGLAESRAVLLDTEVFTVSGGGEVDLRDETLDMAFDTATREASIASLAVPFLVQGPIKSPKVVPDPVGTAKAAAKAAGALAGGQAGALGAVIGSVTGSGGDAGGGGQDVNPCTAALAAIGQEGAAGAGGGTASPAASEPAGSPAEAVTKGVEDAAKGAVEDAEKAIGEGVKKLFGD